MSVKSEHPCSDLRDSGEGTGLPKRPFMIVSPLHRRCFLVGQSRGDSLWTGGVIECSSSVVDFNERSFKLLLHVLFVTI